MHPKLVIVFALGVLTAVSTHAQTDIQSGLPVASAQTPNPTTENVTTTPSSTVRTKEDWSALPLAKSGLPTNEVGGLLVTKTELPIGCTRELLRLEWRRNDPLDLYVIRPAAVEHPPVDLVLLNYTFDTDLFRVDYWCSQAKHNGIAIVGFGSALSWQRFHSPRPIREWFVSELQEALTESTHDVQMVLNYLETRQDLDMSRIGMYGQGSGGAIAILAASVDPRIVALDLSDPWGDWSDWLKGSKQIPEEERAGYLKPEFLQKVANLDPIDYLPSLMVKSLRIQQVADDPVTPLTARAKIASAAPDAKDVVQYPDREAQHKAVELGGITAWLAGQLQTGTSMANGISH